MPAQSSSVEHKPLPATYLALVYQHEDGGKFEYVDNPHDHGGPTKGGVTLATLAEYRGRPCTADDVKNLTIEEASALYQKLFWQQPGYDTLPLDAHTLDNLFDFGMGSGTGTATRVLQGLLHLTQDGHVGPGTRGACVAFQATHATPYLNNALVRARIAYYDKIVAEKPDQAEFLDGWCNRANSFLVVDATTSITKRTAAHLRTAATHLGTAAVTSGVAAASLGGSLQDAHDKLLPLADGHPLLQKAAMALGAGAVGCGIIGGVVSFAQRRKAPTKLTVTTATTPNASHDATTS